MAEEQELMMEVDPLEAQVAALQKRSKLLAVLLLVAIGLAVGSGVFAVMGDKKVTAHVHDQIHQMEEKLDSGQETAIEKVADPVREVGVIHPVGNFVVNLLDSGNLRYVNCRVEVEVDDSATVAEITKREALFKDAVISLLGNLSYEDVLGVEGKSRIREELLVRFNRILPKGQVTRVYLTEFVVQ